jgi:hypothetical protein
VIVGILASLAVVFVLLSVINEDVPSRDASNETSTTEIVDFVVGLLALGIAGIVPIGVALSVVDEDGLAIAMAWGVASIGLVVGYGLEAGGAAGLVTSSLVAGIIGTVVSVMAGGIVDNLVPSLFLEEHEYMFMAGGFVALLVVIFVMVAVTFVLADFVAFVVAGVVVFVVAGVVAGIIAFVIAFVVAFVIALVLLGGVAGGMFGAVLSLTAIAPSWSAWLCLGVAWSLSGLGLPWGLSLRYRISGLLFILISLAALVGVEQGGTVAGLFFILMLLVGFRLPSSLAAAIAGAMAYFRSRLGSVSTLRLLPMVPPFSDEIVWTPVPFLGRLLVRAFAEDAQAGLEAIRTVAGSLHQGRAARQALARITFNTLQDCNDLAAIEQVASHVTWLPNDLGALGRDVSEIVPRLFQTSRSVAVALASDSPYNRRLGLSGAADELANLRQNLPLLVARRTGRWTPVVEGWQRILKAELERSSTQQVGEIPNPYQTGRPLHASQAALFKGRRDLVNKVATAILERNRPTLILYGSRRMGKTSFLMQLPRLLPGDTIPVFVDLQGGAATGSTANLLYSLARAMVRDARIHRVSLPLVEREAFRRDNPIVVFSDWLQERALPALGERRLLLTLDEFEKLGRAVKIGQVGEAVLDEFRSLIQHQAQLSFLFAGVATMDELGPGWSSYFINVEALRVTYLRPEETEDLIRNPDPASGFFLTYDDAVVTDIVTLTRGHPYLAQQVCADLVREANARQVSHATPDLLEAALVRALQSGAPYFRNVWDEMTGTDPASVAAGQGLLRRLAASAGPLPIPLEGADVAVRRAVDRMTRLDVIEEVAGGYQFQVPLIKRWVIERAPMSLEE